MYLSTHHQKQHDTDNNTDTEKHYKTLSTTWTTQCCQTVMHCSSVSE